MKRNLLLTVVAICSIAIPGTLALTQERAKVSGQAIEATSDGLSLRQLLVLAHSISLKTSYGSNIFKSIVSELGIGFDVANEENTLLANGFPSQLVSFVRDRQRIPRARPVQVRCVPDCQVGLNGETLVGSTDGGKIEVADSSSGK